VLTLSGVSVGFQGVSLLSDLTLDLPKPGIYVVFGKSGSGKSLIAKVLARQVRPSAGTIKVLDADMSKRPAKALSDISFAFEDSGPPVNMRALDYIYYFAEANRISGAKARTRLLEWFPSALVESWRVSLLLEMPSSQRRMVEAAKALVLARPIAVIDGVFGVVGDAEGQVLLEALAKYTAGGRLALLLSPRPPHSAEMLVGVFELGDGTVQPAGAGVHGVSGAVTITFGSFSYRAAQAIDESAPFDVVHRYDEGVRLRPKGSLADVIAFFEERGIVIKSVSVEED
jgi:ABC-type multidrug transport system ATPase subunit